MRSSAFWRVAVVIFALVHNFAFNWRGFVAHVDIILGGASQGYRMFPRTLAGEWDLLALTLRIVQRALGIPVSMFTCIFALARTVGWIAQWQEMITDPEYKIGRPRQLYNGAPRRDVVPMNKRS